MAENDSMKENGFTLIELLVVIAIFGILATLALFFSLDFFRTYASNSEQITLVSALSKARSQSLANIDRAPHGVHITPSSYTMFEGSSYATRTQSLDQVLSINSALNPTTTTDIVFDQLTGNAAGCSTSCVITLSGSNGNETVTINSQGAILW